MADATNTSTPVKRRFVFNGMVLDDPEPGMTPMKVAEFYSLLHAELTNVTVKGPTRTADGFDEYKFTAQVGTFN